MEKPKWLMAGLSENPRILRKSAGRSSCSIFKVPAPFLDDNTKHLYLPRIVSIGPFHHGQSHLQMMEEHKFHYLRKLLERTQLSLDDVFDIIKPLEEKARRSYAEDVYDTCPNHFLSVMVVDGCFVVELLRKVAGPVPFHMDDPISSVAWILPLLLRDLILVENQLPFCIIQELFERTGPDSKTRPVELCYRLFSTAMGYWPKKAPWENKEYKAEHLLDLLWTSIIPPGLKRNDLTVHQRVRPLPSSQVIPSVLKLRRAGIDLRCRRKKALSDKATTTSFLDVRFTRCGVMELPKLTVDPFMAHFLSNCLAYENCHRISTKHFTTYIFLMDCLIKSTDEIQHLSNCDIIENQIGTDTKLATFINNLGKNVSVDTNGCYLRELFRETKLYQNSWSARWRSCRYPFSLMLRRFTYTYFNTPWSFISVVNAFIMLIFTVLQTAYAMIAYYQSKGSSEQ